MVALNSFSKDHIYILTPLTQMDSKRKDKTSHWLMKVYSRVRNNINYIFFNFIPIPSLFVSLSAFFQSNSSVTPPTIFPESLRPVG